MMDDGDAIIDVRKRKVHFRAWNVEVDCMPVEEPLNWSKMGFIVEAKARGVMEAMKTMKMVRPKRGQKPKAGTRRHTGPKPKRGQKLRT